MSPIDYIAITVAAFAIGSIPVASFVATCMGQEEDAKCKILATAKCLADAVKGFLPVFIACWISTEYGLSAAAGVFLGHNFPIWKNAKGGTGLAVLFGALLAIHPVLGLYALIAWGIALFIYAEPTVAALTAALVVPLSASILKLPFHPAMLVPFSTLIIWRHRKKLLGLVRDESPDDLADDAKPLQPRTTSRVH